MGFTESFSAAELNVDDLVFDPETGMATKKKKKSSMSGDPLINPPITEEKASNYQVTSKIKLRGSVIKRPGVVKGYTVTPSLLIWSEDDFAVSRICYTKRQKKMPKKPEVTCPLVVEQPQSLAIIGRKPLQKASGENLRGEFAEIWVSLKEERPSGTVFTVSAVDGETGQIVGKSGDYFVRPVDMVFRQDGSWILFGERTRQSIRKFDASLRCQSMIVFKDYITGLGVTEKDQWVFGFYTPRGMIARLISDRQGHQLKEVPCDTPVPLITPLEVAMAQAQDLGSAPDSGPDTVVRLSQALERTEFWEEKRENTADEGWRQSWEKGVQAEKPLGHAEGSKPSVKDRTWRGRPVFLVPWIGAEDALGYQLGAVSVPLMDHLQNETIRATVLVGVSSRFPYQEIALTSTRFQPTYNMVVYRQQTYNGQLRLRSTNELKTSYLDEKGMRFEVSRPTRIFGLAGSVDGGVKVADLKPYLGPTVRGRGVLVEPTLSISVSKKVLDTVNLNASVSGRAAPRGLNKVWDYNQTGFNTSASRRLNLLSSNLSIGLEGSRTRGRAKRDFTESYRPLKTFIPGSGGGYNQNNFPISNEGSGLFSGQYGDSQARAKVDWTFPLIKDVDQLFWIIYAESLDFTAFYNYGGAWKGAAPPKGWNHLTSAHGYNLDLQMENKGVRFNAGIGTGQVVGKKFEVYMTTGFDALF